MRGRVRHGDHPLRRLLTLLVGFALGVGAAVLYLVTNAQVQPRPVSAHQPHPPMSVTLGDPFLTTLTRDALAGTEIDQRLAKLTVTSEDGVLVVSGEADMAGTPILASATLRPIVRNSKLVVDVVSTDFGSFPVPPLETLVEEQVNARLTALLGTMPVTITGVSVARGRGMTVTCAVDLQQLPSVQTSVR